MGMIYQRKYKRSDGTIGLTAVWWVKYYVNGQPRRESTKTKSERKARGILCVKEGNAKQGLPDLHKKNRKTVGELLEDVVADYKNHGYKTLEATERRIRLHLLPFFGTYNASCIEDDQVRKFVTERKAQTYRGKPTSNAEINRELAILKRGYKLNERAVTDRPKIKKLEEDNVREGFFERGEFEKVRAALPAEYRPLLTLAYVTGWRTASELLPMEWRQVDWTSRTLRLEPGTTKNKKGREFPFTDELEAALLEQRAYTDAVRRKDGAINPCVFPRTGKPIQRTGKPISKHISSWRRPWLQALLKVGLATREVDTDTGQPKKGGKIIPAVIPHDFRRTAVRNLVRAGVPEAVAMKLTGHMTRSVFDRYNIVSGSDLREAVAKLNVAATAATAAGTVSGTVGALAGKK